VVERRALRDTFQQVGPDAPTLAGSWTVADLAAHLVSGEQLGGVPTFLGRGFVARFGLHLNSPLAPVYQVEIRRFRRHGFDWALNRLAAAPPRLLGYASIAPVSLLEVWVHHEDVRRANAMAPRDPATGPDLVPSLAWLLLRYHRKALGRIGVRVVLPGGKEVSNVDGGDAAVIRGAPGEVLLWLAGRMSAANVCLEGPDQSLRRLLAVKLQV
jgi:uncharacterized protein (TIGR03085 family)